MSSTTDIREIQARLQAIKRTTSMRRGRYGPRLNVIRHSTRNANSNRNFDAQVRQTPMMLIDLSNIPSPRSQDSNSTSDDDDVIFVSHVVNLSPSSEVAPTTQRRDQRTISLADEFTCQRRRRQQSESDSDPSPKLQKTSDSEHYALKCSVCWENMLEREPLATKCGHVFCGKCIRRTIILMGQCPRCKTRLCMSNLTRIYF